MAGYVLFGGISSHVYSEIAAFLEESRLLACIMLVRPKYAPLSPNNMNNIAATITAIASILGSLVAIINTVKKLKTSIFRTRSKKERKVETVKNELTMSDLFFLMIGGLTTFVGLGSLLLMRAQKDGPATMQVIVVVGMSLANIIVGNLILITTLISANGIRRIDNFPVASKSQANFPVSKESEFSLVADDDSRFMPKN